MRVLGEEATADPTAIEQKVQEQMRERAQVRCSSGPGRSQPCSLAAGPLGDTAVG